jgi:hypothetical protein
LSAVFSGKTGFNQALQSWDTSRVITMASMFAGAVDADCKPQDDGSSFNQPLDHWDVSSVTDFERMFYAASKFNQPLAGWDVSRVNYAFGDFDYNFKIRESECLPPSIL